MRSLLTLASRLPRNRTAAWQPIEAVEKEIQRHHKLDVVARSEGTAVGDREGHLHDVGVAGAELVHEAGGRVAALL
jgi:hypothetical protein